MKGATLGTLLLTSTSSLAAGEPWNELPRGEGQRETYVNCIACHSTRIISQQGMTLAQWDETVTWMVTEHGMPELDEPTRLVILEYLSDVFPPSRPHYSAPSD